MNPNLPIREIMTTNPVTVRGEESLTKLREIFSRYTFHHLPVTDAENNLQGIISREDFYKVAYVLSLQEGSKAAATKNRFQKLCANDIMTKYPLQLDPEDSIGLAADIFLANKFHALPIVEEGRLVGIVTSHDLLSYSFNSPVEELVAIEEYDEE